MIQSIYTSVSNADTVSCNKKGTTISSEPIPLLKNKYLSEYRTELEKAKVRKNLGIADDQSLLWGSLNGHIEELKDLVTYIESKWKYQNSISEDINTVAEALDYVIYFVNNFKSDNESIVLLKDDVLKINKNIEDINILINLNTDDIDSLEKSLEETNKNIEELNKNLSSINVDNNILNWVKNSITNSNTITLEEDTTLNVIISLVLDNAVIIDNGLYVKDYSKEIAKIETLESDIKKFETLGTYQTELTPETSTPTTVGGITQGTKVSDLKDKSITEILDIMLFPTYVRPLVHPNLYYSSIPNLVEVGSNIVKPELTFIKGDAGEEISREDKLINPVGLEVSSETYDLFGNYTYQGKVFYNEGLELLDNKNLSSGQKIPEGNISTTLSVTTTYPWYTASKNGDIPETKQPLVKFGISNEIEFSLLGQAQIWLPGDNSTIQSFTVNIGLGEYLNVDMNGWSEPITIPYNGINYKVWTKKDTYSAILSHKIKFTLAL